MGRRRERASGFGRRQVLQLNDSRRDDSPYRGQSGGHWPARNEANALSGLMAHYGESEESEEEEEMTPPRAPPSPPEVNDPPTPEPEERPISPKPISKENGHKEKKGNISLDIDSKVANFLAEIDALDADSNDIDGEPLPETELEPEAAAEAEAEPESSVPSPAPPLSDPVEKPAEPESSDSKSDSDDAEEEAPQPPSVPVTVWHHCQDENTQYYYYWNTTTNEVTWEIPLEYSQYLLQVKEYDEAFARYEVIKSEYEERIKSKPKTKRTKASTNVQKPNGTAAESESVDEPHPLPTAEKKPVKSWLLKKIRETYGSKYDTEDNDPQDSLADPAASVPSEVGPQLPPTDVPAQAPEPQIGPQLPQPEIGPQFPQLPEPEIGPQLPQPEIGPHLPQSEIGPKLPHVEIGPQLPPVEIGPQLPPGRSATDLVAETDPHFPRGVDAVEEPMIGPQMPPNFGSVPPPADLYESSSVSKAVSVEKEEEMMIGPLLAKDTDFPDADSSCYSGAVSDSDPVNIMMYDVSTEADASVHNIGKPSATAAQGPTRSQSPLNSVKAKTAESDEDEDEEEEFDLDFIDKQLEEPLESQYIKKKPFVKEEPTVPKVKFKAEVKTEVKVEEDSDMEFDIDDIDQELEAALEKKKAEEKKLERKEVVASTTKRKQNEDSSSSDKHKKAKVTEEEKPAPQKKKMDKGEIKIKAEVADLATLVMDKLEFLDITRKGLSKLQMLLIEIETRIGDWREGALNTQYLLGRLEDAEQQLHQYEASAAPTGWACHWDRVLTLDPATGPEGAGTRLLNLFCKTSKTGVGILIGTEKRAEKAWISLLRTYKRYFYFHLTTGASQWDYPDDEASRDVTRSDAHSTAAELPSAAPSDRPETAQVSSSQVDGEREEGSSEPAAPLPQCAQVDSTTLSTDSATGVNTAAVSSSVSSSFTAKTEPTSSSGGESSGVSGASSAFAVDPSLFQDLFAPAPPPPAEPPPPGVEATPSGLGPPRPPPGLATSSLPLSRSPPPPPPGTTPPPSTIEDVEMEIAATMDPTTSSLLAAAPPPPPPLDSATPAAPYPGPEGEQYQVSAVAAAAVAPGPPAVIVASPFISNTTSGAPLPAPVPAPPPPGNVSTIVAPPVISSGAPALSAPPPPSQPPPATPPDTPPRTHPVYDPALDGVPLVDSSHASLSSSSSSSSTTAAATAQAKEKRRKKEKKSAMGLSLKKKKLPSLVAKWQEVQEAVEREASKHAKEEESP